MLVHPPAAPRRPVPFARGFATLAALLGLGLSAGCAKETARRGGRVPILVTPVEQRAIPYELAATGTVEASQSAEITARVGGAVSRIAFREGEEVRAGQVLFEIDPRPFAAAAERAAGVLARDRAQAAVARLEYERAVALADRQVISTSDLDQKRAAFEALAATARADSASLVAARLDLAYATVRAPIGGRAGDLVPDLGDLVRANDATPLLTIHNITPARVRFTVPQDDLPALQARIGPGTRVEVAPAAGDDSTWIAGKLVFVDNAVDAASGTILLKAEFANRDGALWPGTFVRVRLVLDEQADAVVVPAVAVTKGQQGAFAYVVRPDTTVEVRPVTVARAWRDWVVIGAGLRPGETVVTDGQLRLSDGAKAVVRTPAPAAARGEGATGATTAAPAATGSRP